MATLSNISSLLIGSDQIEKSKARLDFDPAKKEDQLQGRSPVENVSTDQAKRRMEFAIAEGAARVDLERLIGPSDLMSINYLERGMIAARSVGRVLVRDNSGSLIGYGTGFLISDRLMITNNHVLEGAEMAAKSQLELNYQMNVLGKPLESEIFGFLPAEFFFTHKDLDFTVVAVETKSSRGTQLSEFGSLPLIGQTGKVLEGEYVSCIEHPGGEYKEIALRENQLLKAQPNFLWYKTDTAPGASGSPMFNDSWQVVALHHSGVPSKDANGNILTVDGKIWSPEMGESKVQWIANEGVRISSIVAALSASSGQHPLVKAAVGDSASRVIEITPRTTVPSSQSTLGLQSAKVPSAPSLSLTPDEITIPLTLNITIGKPAVANVGPAAGAISVERAVTGRGYDELFLGTRVSVPVLNSKQEQDVVRLNGSPLIPYTHFSVCLNKARRMANFVAWNINGDQLKALGRQGLRFDYDDRISREFQIGDEVYSDNKLDRGHLARRADLVWGTKTEAADANRQSFMFPNITPQHQAFNQSEKHGLWGLLENAVFEDVSVNGLRVSVMAGPIFKNDDLEYRGVRVPRDFWKILAFVDEEDGRLKAKAFVLTQKDLLNDIEAFALDSFRLYQVTIDDLQGLTGLAFGDLRALDTFAPEMAREALAAGGKRAVREVKSRDELFR